MIRLGLIGMGYTGWQHLRVAADLNDLAVTAATDADGARLQDLPAGVRAADDVADLLADAAVDAVSVCLPHDLHAEVVTAALAAGKHVLVEKPLALDLAGAEAIAAAAAAAAADRVVLVEMTHRFYPPMVRARQWLQAGRLGRLYAVEDRIVQPVADGALPAWMFARRHAGGGVALTNGVHMLDRVAWLCGQPLRLLAGTAGSAAARGDVEDTAAMLLELADGTPVQVLAAWPRGEGPTDDELTLYGQAGTLRVRSWHGLRFEPLGGRAESWSGYADDLDGPARVRVGMRGALQAFVDACLGRGPTSPGAAELLTVQRLIDEFYRRTRRA